MNVEVHGGYDDTKHSNNTKEKMKQTQNEVLYMFMMYLFTFVRTICLLMFLFSV